VSLLHRQQLLTLKEQHSADAVSLYSLRLLSKFSKPNSVTTLKELTGVVSGLITGKLTQSGITLLRYYETTDSCETYIHTHHGCKNIVQLADVSFVMPRMIVDTSLMRLKK
jgi:hypothetical protein